MRAQVKEGTIVAVLEAMKMQNNLKATRSGIVKAVHFEACAHVLICARAVPQCSVGGQILEGARRYH